LNFVGQIADVAVKYLNFFPYFIITITRFNIFRPLTKGLIHIPYTLYILLQKKKIYI